MNCPYTQSAMDSQLWRNWLLNNPFSDRRLRRRDLAAFERFRDRLSTTIFLRSIASSQE
jgi:hypothetical protein